MKKKEKSNYRRLKLWWKFEGQYIISDIKQGLKNLVKWFPIIWKDRNYDHAYIYTMLQKKLELQSDFIGQRALHTTALQDSRNMKICARLMGKIKEGFYSSEYLDYYESTMDFIPFTDEDGSKLYEMKQDIVSENFEEFFKKYPLVYKQILAEKSDDELSNKDIAFYMSRRNEERAKKLMFNILETQIDNWWD